MEDAEEPPPLEDDSSFTVLSKKDGREDDVKMGEDRKRDLVQEVEENGDDDDETPLIEKMMEAAKIAERKKDIARRKGREKSDKQFGSGFKKGFFNRKKKKTTTKKKNAAQTSSEKKTTPLARTNEGGKDDAVTYLRKSKKEGKSNLVLPEVQSTMSKSAANMLKKGDWVNEKLLEKIRKNPELARKFMDPRFAQFAQRFQENPKRIMEEAKGNPDLQEFLTSLMGVMGDHFTEMGKAAEEGGQSRKKKTLPSAPAMDSDVKRVLDDPELKALLTDPKMKQVLQDCQTKPGALQYYMRIPETRAKLSRMASAGLIRLG